MDKKRIDSIKARIRRAQGTLSCFGDMTLRLEMDAMTHGERIALQAGLLQGRIPVRYPYLDSLIAKVA